MDKSYSLSRIAEVRNSFRVLVEATDKIQDLGDEKNNKMDLNLILYEDDD